MTEEKQFSIVFSKKEALVVMRALERFQQTLGQHEPEPSNDCAYENQRTLELIHSALFKLGSIERQNA